MNCEGFPKVIFIVKRDFFFVGMLETFREMNILKIL